MQINAILKHFRAAKTGKLVNPTGATILRSVIILVSFRLINKACYIIQRKAREGKVKTEENLQLWDILRGILILE